MFDVLRYLYINYFSVHITGSDKVSCIHVTSNREESSDDEQNNVNHLSKDLVEDPTNNLDTVLFNQNSKNKIKVPKTGEKAEPNEIEMIGTSLQDENQHLPHSSTNNRTFESKMVQVESDRNIKCEREDISYLSSTMITAGIDDELNQNYPKIKDLCTLIPLKTFEKWDNDLEVSKTSRKKKKDMFQVPNDISHIKSVSNDKSNFLFINDKMANGLTNNQSVRGLSHVENKKRRRKKLKRNHDQQSFAKFQPLLSLGKFDDINASLNDNSKHKSSSNFVIKYHEGSLIHEVNGKQLENSNSDNTEIKTNFEKKVYYQCGKYDEYLKRVEEIAEENNHIHNLGFSNLQYAIRKELDQVLQRDDRLRNVEKLDPKLRMDHQNSPENLKGSVVKNCDQSSLDKEARLFNDIPTMFKNKENNEKRKLEQQSSEKDTDSLKKMKRDGANGDNIDAIHTQEGN